jgi:hypothetical protein
VFLVALNVREVPPRLRFSAIGIGSAALTVLVVAGVPLAFQFFGPGSLLGGVTVPNLPQDLAGFTVPGTLQYYASPADVAANRHFLANAAENTGYLGWPLIGVLVACCVVLVLRRDRFVYWWIPTTLFTVSVSLGAVVQLNKDSTGVRTPWDLLDRMPVINSVVTARFSVITTLLVALLLAWTLATMRDRNVYIAGLLGVALALVPLRPGGPHGGIMRDTTPTFFSSGAASRTMPAGSVVYVMPQGASPFVAADVMRWQIESHLSFSVVGGYAVFSRDGKTNYHGQLPRFAELLQRYADRGVLPGEDQIVAARPSIRPSKVRYIVITLRQRHAALATKTAVAITGCTPSRVDDVTVCTVPRRLPV